MEVLDAIKRRKSVRFYTRQEISQDNVQKLIDAARWAPSGHRVYARKLIVVQSQELIRRIKAVSPGLHDGPVALMILCRDKNREKEVLENPVPSGDEEVYLEKLEKEGFSEARAKLMTGRDIAISAQNICLEATALGIGSCMVGKFDHNAVRKLLNLPEYIEPDLFVALGYRDTPADVAYLRRAEPLPMRNRAKDILVGWIK